MDRQILTFRDIVAPTAPEAFFGEIFRQKPLHVPGADDKFAAFFSWEKLNELLSMTTIWSDQCLELTMGGKGLPAEMYCYQGPTRDNVKGNIVDPDRLVAQMQQGATLTLNFIDRLTPPLRSLSQTLAAVTGTSVNCSTFVSWPNTQGYASHFDTTQVFVFHIAGRKRWRIYEGRFPHASHTANAQSKYQDFPQEFHEQHKGRVLQELEMTPGDFLYLPHGQYHDARTGDEPSVHLSFAVRYLVGQDFVNALSRDLPHDPFFLQHLPPIGDAGANQSARQALAQRMGQILADPQVAQGLETLMRRSAYERIASYKLPERARERKFRVRSLGKRLERNGEGWKLLAGNAAVELDAAAGMLAQWAMDKDYFADTWLAEDLGALEPAARGDALQQLHRAGLIDPMH